MHSFKQYLVIIASLCLVFVVVNTQLAQYLTQVVAFLIVISVIFMLKSNKSISDTLSNSSFFNLLVITAILLIIFLTGGLTSNIFFLAYFLLFAIPFMFKPRAVFVFALGIFILFLNDALKNNTFSNLVTLGSVLFLAPLAFFFGNEFRKREKLSQAVEEKTDKITQNADELLHEEADRLDEKGIEKIDKILEETDKLKKTTEET